MKELISRFPDNIHQAVEIAKNNPLIVPKKDIENIVLCGRGGSGIGGKIIENWTSEALQVPCVCVSEYNIPSFVGPNTLFIGTSYSGNTEETLYSLNEAKSRGAVVVGITSGGALEQFCKENTYNYILIPGGNPPRSALAFSLVQLLHVLESFNLIADTHINSMTSAAELLENNQEEIHNSAQNIAKHLFGKVGIYYSETKYEGVVVRARQQFNENSKFLGWHHVIPEMNHNELVGWTGGDKRFAPVFLDASDIFERNRRRFEITRKAVEEKTGSVFTLQAKGKDLVERSLYFIHVLDWASFYLCEMNQADIMDIAIIDYLKGELSKA